MSDRFPTQYEMVLTWLKTKGNITAMEGFMELYIVDLAGVIRDLRKNYIIEDEWVYKNNYYGKPIKFKRYFYKGEK